MNIVYAHRWYPIIVRFEGMEKFETKERWELPKSDVLLGAPVPDLHEAEDAEHGSGDCGESERTSPRPVEIPKWNKGFAWLSDL